MHLGQDFIANEEYFSIDSSKTELERAIGLANNLKKIHHLTVKNFQNIDQLFQNYIATGLEIFGMEMGIISRVDGDLYIVIDVLDKSNAIKKEMEFPLADTYCAQVVKTNSVIGYAQVGNLDELKNHPVYVNMKLESYLSSPIHVGGEIYGTFNFTSHTPRKNGVSEPERDLIALMAGNIGIAIEHAKQQQELRETNERLLKLTGFVAHDLRGPLSNIKGLSAFINSTDIKETVKICADRGLEIVQTILVMTAMGTGKIKMEKSETNLSTLILETARSYEGIGADKGLIFQYKVEEDIQVIVDESRMRQVLTNLISNTIKYTPQKGVINIELKRENRGKVKFNISNDTTQEISEDKTHSIGFGLEIVREILELHRSKLEMNQEKGRFSVAFVLKEEL
ncbi:GAF domain-containing sensor histidine kinase [Reichenbachiella versicolor]|uniref:GAF domain-containing sensor histidine kinase n=1 Tax=Reichenbachiella versicolor TaxID=1821036 RepID=UPI000D6E7293|nr:GAF domain-containing sensor histidine kinase [Reichenbachiella versicolor]